MTAPSEKPPARRIVARGTAVRGTVARGMVARGTPYQRARATLVAGLAVVLSALPTVVVDAAADAVGELWYRLAPERAAMARGNLAHVVGWLAANGRGSPRARAAAVDPAALERLVRLVFRHAVRTYTETLRTPATARDVRRGLVIETPEALEAALAPGGAIIFASLHFGTMMGGAAVLAERVAVPITAPMESIDDPELQRVLRRFREFGGARTVDLADARRELRAALARGEGVGLVADRDLTGGGFPVSLFGLPTRLPDRTRLPRRRRRGALPRSHRATGRGTAFRRARRVRPAPASGAAPPGPDRGVAGTPRRARSRNSVATAPEQWRTVFYPIWESVGPRPREAAPREPGPVAAS